MSRYRVAVHIVPRKGIRDPQGKTGSDALHSLGFDGVSDTRIGRHIVLHIAAADAKDAEVQVREMCGKLLANPVTEDFEIAAVESA